jgi:hypothetical protein
MINEEKSYSFAKLKEAENYKKWVKKMSFALQNAKL